jgi:diaminopimelate decarboxylase
VTERIGLVIVDNPAELERLAPMANGAGATQPILLRVIPSVTAGGHPSIETGGEDSKFGMTPPEALTAIHRATELPGVEPVGLHTHVGSQIEGAAPFLSAVEVLIEVAGASKDTGAALTRFDVGGGFAATYVDEAPADLATIALELTERLRPALERHGLPPGELIVEPGRAIVANAGITLYRVGAVKERGGRLVAAVDGGMSDNIRSALYGSRYTLALASPAPDRQLRIVDVVGKHCESGDVIARGCELPEPRPGDLLAVAATGAYCYSMASNYNQVGRLPPVAVRNGTATPWLRRETFDDLRALEMDEAVPRPERG